MANILPREKRTSVLHHLVEGNTLRSTTRLTGVHRITIQNLLVEFGSACQRFMDSQLRGLTLEHLEVDEVWTFVGKKQASLTVDERAERHDLGDVFLWTALDAETKLVASFLVGKRSADYARRLMNDLASRLVFPKPHASDPHAYGVDCAFASLRHPLNRRPTPPQPSLRSRSPATEFRLGTPEGPLDSGSMVVGD